MQRWDIEKYKGPVKNFSISTNEGTWMNLDVSADGQEIVFDLLGDIYVMPITGGTAKLLSGGIAWDIQPRLVRTENIFLIPVIKAVQTTSGS